ncbi:hypothetical protein Tco_0073638 [Tanacetum coccineum]
MASLFTFKECSSCGALHNKSCACSEGGFVSKFVRDPNKIPDSSQRPPHNYPNYGDPVDGLYCRQCALLRKKLREIFDENEFFQDLLNPSESSNDKNNVVNLPQEPFVFNKDPGENSSQSPPHIDRHYIKEEEEKSLDDWDHLLDFNLDDVPLLGTSSSAGGHLTQEEATKEALAIRMSRKFALLEEERPIIETMSYHDKYKKILDEVWKDKVELDGKIVKEEEEVVKRIKGEALKEKDDPRAFIFSIRLEERRDEEVVGRGFLRTIGGIVNTPKRLFSTFDGFCHQTFRAARSDVMRNAESDSDDEEEYHIKRNKFGAPIYGPKPAPYLNCNDPSERSLAIQTTMGTHDDEAGSSRSKRSRQHETVEEVLLPQVHHEFLLWEGCNRDAKSRYNTRLAQLLPRHIYSSCVVYWDVLNRMSCNREIDDMLRIRLREAGSDEEIFTLVAWIRAFNINEPIYAELCHEF